MLCDVEPQVSVDLPRITATVVTQLATSGLYCQQLVKGCLSYTLPRCGGCDSSAGGFSVVMLYISIPPRTSTKRHEYLLLQAPCTGYVA